VIQSVVVIMASVQLLKMSFKASDVQGLSLLGSSNIMEIEREADMHVVMRLYGKSNNTCISLNLRRCDM